MHAKGLDMIRKALIRTCIFEYIDKHELVGIDDIFANLGPIFKHLREHQHHKDLIPKGYTFQMFVNSAHNGLDSVRFQSFSFSF